VSRRAAFTIQAQHRAQHAQTGHVISEGAPSVSRALPPVGVQSTAEQLLHTTTVCEWLNTVVLRARQAGPVRHATTFESHSRAHETSIPLQCNAKTTVTPAGTKLEA